MNPPFFTPEMRDATGVSEATARALENTNHIFTPILQGTAPPPGFQYGFAAAPPGTPAPPLFNTPAPAEIPVPPPPRARAYPNFERPPPTPGQVPAWMPPAFGGEGAPFDFTPFRPPDARTLPDHPAFRGTARRASRRHVDDGRTAEYNPALFHRYFTPGHPDYTGVTDEERAHLNAVNAAAVATGVFGPPPPAPPAANAPPAPVAPPAPPAPAPPGTDVTSNFIDDPMDIDEAGAFRRRRRSRRAPRARRFCVTRSRNRRGRPSKARKRNRKTKKQGKK